MLQDQKKFPRLLSLDVFRGLTIALMILVNCPGNEATYRWLEHSEWNGCTLADLVFPFFIFIVGVASVFSLSKAHSKGIPSQELLYKIAKRTLLIFLIGLFINAFPYHFHFETIRVFGVLQRIAICYFVASFLFLFTRLQTQAGTHENLRAYLTEQLFSGFSPPNASLMYALSYTLFWLIILTILYRKKIYIRL